MVIASNPGTSHIWCNPPRCFRAVGSLRGGAQCARSYAFLQGRPRFFHALHYQLCQRYHLHCYSNYLAIPSCVRSLQQTSLIPEGQC